MTNTDSLSKIKEALECGIKAVAPGFGPRYGRANGLMRAALKDIEALSSLARPEVEAAEAKMADSLADRLEWALKLLKTPVLYMGKPEELEFIERALEAHAKHRIASGKEDKRGLL